MKKVFIICALIMMLSLAGCTNDAGGSFAETDATAPAGTFGIDTSLTTFYFPDKWVDIVKVDVKDSMVEFSAYNTSIFKLVFEDCDGDLIGTYNDTPIYIVDYNISNENKTKEEYDNLCAMQEDINVILSYLQADRSFKICQ